MNFKKAPIHDTKYIQAVKESNSEKELNSETECKETSISIPEDAVTRG
jgi:hypothetical protein